MLALLALIVYLSSAPAIVVVIRRVRAAEPVTAGWWRLATLLPIAGIGIVLLDSLTR